MFLRKIALDHVESGGKFLIVGVINTLSGVSVIYALKLMFNTNDILANVLGYAVGISISFTLNSRWTFGGSPNVSNAFLKYCAVLLFAYLLNLVTVIVCIDVFGINSYVAQALGIIPYTVFTYVLSKVFVFRTVKT